MESTKLFLKDLIKNSAAANTAFKRNILKEYLQILVLDYLYSHAVYSRLVFYGGSCLKHLYGLPRLSEDLDFVDLKKEIDLEKLAGDVAAYFNKNTDLAVNISRQKFRLYLKFRLLHDLGLAKTGESDLLFLKIEIFADFKAKKYEIESKPLFSANKSLIIRTFDLPTLMATKINALLHRRWEKTDKTGKTLASVKGRDYFDLMWYLEKRLKPNLNAVIGIASQADLKTKLLAAVEKADERSLKLDLESLIDRPEYVDRISKNLKSILTKQISESF